MTALLDRPAMTPGATPAGPDGALRRLAGWARRHRTSLLVLTPLLLLTGVVRFVGMVTAPQRIDDEGTYVAQAYAVDKLGSLAHYTYWYDHPPLGWIQIAGYTWLTDAFNRAPNAVAAGREAMLVAAVASAGLLYVLARRLGVSRWGSGAAVLIMGLSPLAVQFQRTVYLDNVATPWALAAFVLALSPRNRLAATAGAGLAFAVAVLSKETYLLLLPALVYLVLRHSAASTRRYALTVAGTLFVLAGAGYGLLALIKGELLPGPNRVSLVGGLEFQLGGRQSSGSLFDPSSLSRRTLDTWLQLDTVLPVATVLAAVTGLFVRRLRPIAVGMVFLLLMMLRPGYLPVPYVIALLPFGALLVAGVVDAAVRAALRTGRWRSLAAVTATVAVLLGGAGVATAAPAWTGQLRGLALANLDAPVAQGEAWATANIPKGQRMLVDDAMWVDLVRSGRDRNNIVWFYKADTDSAVIDMAPNGWRDYGWVITTQSMRRSADGSPTIAQAIANSTLAASFGQGNTRVEVRQVHPEGIDAVDATNGAAASARSQGGTQLAGNPAIAADTATADLLTGGRVDSRAMAGLAALAAQQPVTLLGAPAVDGEDAAGTPRRQLLLSGGAPVQQFFATQTGALAPTEVTTSGDDVLVTYSAVAPS
jgi:hypothetical protein